MKTFAKALIGAALSLLFAQAAPTAFAGEEPAAASGLTPPPSAGPLDWSSYLAGGPAPSGDAAPLDDPPFVRGRVTLELGAGAYFSPVGLGPHAQMCNYAPIDLRLGYILNTPGEAGCLRGSAEFLVDLMAAPVFNGFGNIFGGPSLLLRYNFVQPECPLVPYVQIGGGFAFNDAYEVKTQRTIGEFFEFLLQAQVGCRYLVNEQWSVNLEGGFQHISNAGLAGRNGGINALGGMISVTYFFRRGH